MCATKGATLIDDLYSISRDCRIIAEVVFFTIWSGMCVITFVGCWVHGSWAQHFEQLRWQFFVQTKAVGQTFNTKLS